MNETTKFCEKCGKTMDSDRNCDLCLDCYEDEWDQAEEEHLINQFEKKGDNSFLKECSSDNEELLDHIFNKWEGD